MAKENIFARAHQQRVAEQSAIKQTLGLQNEVQSAIQNAKSAPSSKKKVRLDVTLPADTKQRLIQYADSKNLSAAVVVQMLIDEHCV